MKSTFVELDPRDPYREHFTEIELTSPRRKDHQDEKFAVVQIVPTGVRCEIGGFAGDACPATNLLAAAADVVITHPNAVNASDINEMASNVLYVEGKSLDDFLLGHLGSSNPKQSNWHICRPHRQSLSRRSCAHPECCAGRREIDCASYTVGASEIGVRTVWSQSGCAVGTVLNPLVILDSVQQLLDNGARAIGGVS